MNVWTVCLQFVLQKKETEMLNLIQMMSQLLQYLLNKHPNIPFVESNNTHVVSDEVLLAE